jgi:two-component system, LytTR family, response regulator
MTPAAAQLRAIIADDEPLARQALRRFLRTHADITVIGEAEDVPSLIAVLERESPDLLFLDVTMPGGSGLDAVPIVTPGTALVFTTAHAEYAATAFDLDAADYLVKPFGQARIDDALARVRRRVASAPDRPLRVLLVRSGTRLHPVPTQDIWRVEGCDDFARVVTAARSWLHGATLASLATQLDPASFVRVHRSHIVNLEHIVRLVPQDDRRLAAEFPDGTRVACSRAGSSALRQRARLSDG